MWLYFLKNVGLNLLKEKCIKAGPQYAFPEFPFYSLNNYNLPGSHSNSYWAHPSQIQQVSWNFAIFFYF